MACRRCAAAAGRRPRCDNVIIGDHTYDRSDERFPTFYGLCRTVTEIAMRCGFYELGRFAGSYREMFGLSPSAVLRTNPAHRAQRTTPGHTEAMLEVTPADGIALASGGWLPRR